MEKEHLFLSSEEYYHRIMSLEYFNLWIISKSMLRYRQIYTILSRKTFSVELELLCRRISHIPLNATQIRNIQWLSQIKIPEIELVCQYVGHLNKWFEIKCKFPSCYFHSFSSGSSKFWYRIEALSMFSVWKNVMKIKFTLWQGISEVNC